MTDPAPADAPTPDRLDVRVFDAHLVRPGDTLLIHVDDRLTAETVHEFCEQIKAALPDVKCVVLSAALSITIRPEREGDMP